MNAKYIIKTFLALMVVFTATSCAEWGELPEGFSYDKVAYDAPEPDPDPDPDPDPTPVKPTERGQIIETGTVDLGLSVKWAACNLGADYCYEEGDKYDFGNDDVNCPEQIGGTKYDHARTVLGGKWATPSIAQWEELKEKCLVEADSFRGVCGYIITGPTKKAIFIPTFQSPYSYSNYYADYWTSTVDMNSNCGYYFYLKIYKSSSYISSEDFRVQTYKRLSNDNCIYIRPVLLN